MTQALLVHGRNPEEGRVVGLPVEVAAVSPLQSAATASVSLAATQPGRVRPSR